MPFSPLRDILAAAKGKERKLESRQASQINPFEGVRTASSHFFPQCQQGGNQDLRNLPKDDGLTDRLGMKNEQVLGLSTFAALISMYIHIVRRNLAQEGVLVGNGE